MEKIALLNDSFVSEVLLQTLAKNKIPTYADENLAKRLSEKGIPLLSKQELLHRLSGNDCAVYVNAEIFIPLISENSNKIENVNAIKLFKNKRLFREFLSDIHPEFYFKEFNISDRGSINVSEGKYFILKPSIGFFALGVKKFSTQREFDLAIAEAIVELSRYKKLFDSSILDEANFLIEEFIEGEEFACDAYFDKNGNPVVLAITEHPFRDSNDSRQLLYYTGKGVMKKGLKHAEKFLDILSKKLKLSNFPVHFEFRLTNAGKFIPIEVNPLRFGGFGLADLVTYSFGINPYEYFFYGKKPDWKNLLENSTEDYYAWVLGLAEGLSHPDLKKFKKTFTKLNAFVETNYETSPVFCVAYAQYEDLNEVLKYLHFDFKEYEH